jgi:LytS/YehU family sensor histidine kinase
LATVIILTRYYSAKANERKQANTELELRALYAQINPHFIFNTLSSAMFFISKNRFDEAYQHISKFSRLLRAYLKSSQERYIKLSEEIDMLENYIELQQTRFENKFDYTIEIENKIPKDNIQIPSLLLQPLLENAINHGLFHKEGKGFLKLQFYQGATNNELICIIEDNGIGRERAKEIKKHSLAQYDSYGTKLTKQLIDIFKQYERMNIYLEYIDKEEPETGTIVKLVIKNIKYVA